MDNGWILIWLVDPDELSASVPPETDGVDKLKLDAGCTVGTNTMDCFWYCCCWWWICWNCCWCFCKCCWCACWCACSCWGGKMILCGCGTCGVCNCVIFCVDGCFVVCMEGCFGLEIVFWFGGEHCKISSFLGVLPGMLLLAELVKSTLGLRIDIWKQKNRQENENSKNCWYHGKFDSPIMGRIGYRYYYMGL